MVWGSQYTKKCSIFKRWLQGRWNLYFTRIHNSKPWGIKIPKRCRGDPGDLRGMSSNISKDNLDGACTIERCEDLNNCKVYSIFERTRISTRSKDGLEIITKGNTNIDNNSNINLRPYTLICLNSEFAHSLINKCFALAQDTNQMLPNTQGRWNSHQLKIVSSEVVRLLSRGCRAQVF